MLTIRGNKQTFVYKHTLPENKVSVLQPQAYKVLALSPIAHFLEQNVFIKQNAISLFQRRREKMSPS